MPKKRNFKRAVSMLIAFLFIFECFPARTFAASAPALTYSIDVEGAKESGGTNVFYANQRGDTVTVRFVMSRTDSQESYSLNTMQNEIEYDMSFFEFVESSISVEKSGLDAELQTRVMGQEIVKVSALNGSEFAPEQVLCSFQLQIKSDAQSDSGWVRCSEAKAVATDYVSATVTERNLEVRLKQSGLTVTATGYDNAYDGAEHAVTATPNVTDGTTVEYSVDNGANWSETAPSLKDAGTVAVKVRAKNDAYFDATADAELKITPKALTVTANAASKTFGDADPDLTYSVDGLVTGDSVSGTLERATGENAGTYAISQGTLSAGDNYAVSFQGANFTISPKDISEASVSLSAHTLTYTGAEQSVSVNAVTLDGTALTEADYSVSGDTRGTNVSAYTVTVTGQGNYTGSASVEWNIVTTGMDAKAENVSVTYDKQPHGIIVTDAPSGATITYSTDNETYSATNPSFTDAGARVVYYKVTASGYDEFTGSATVTIAKRPVVVSGIAAANKVYDGNTNATLIYDNATFDGIIDGDSLTVTASGAFDSADAGENKTVAITGLALGGDAASNYELASEGQQTSASANVTPADMTVTATGYEGVYDRKPHSPAVDAPDGAEILWSDAANGTYAAETPSFTDAGTYTAYYRVQRANYQTVSGSVTVTIAQKSVEGATILLEQNEFIYDGETKTAVVQMVTLPDGDILSETDYGVSDNQTANAGYYLLTVTGQGNYKDTAKVSWTIRNAGASGISAANISTTYDGKPRSISVVGAPDGATITYSTDGETYSETNPAYTDAGTSQTVHYRVTAANYDEFNGSATITIAKRPVTVSGITAANKAYDGNINATLIYDGVTFNGIVDGDELSVSATGTFADAEVGNAKTVNITNLTLGGASVGNYQLAATGQQTETSASITANALNVTASGYNGVYDGEFHGITVNAPDGASVTYSETENGAYSAIAPAYTNAGTYTVFYKVTLTGSDDVKGSQTVNISRKEIIVSGITAANKPYDGNTNATLIYDNVTFDGIISGDELTVTATGTFADAETGNGKTVNITNLTLGGADAANYQLATEGQQTETTANITANALNVTASGYSSVYDGAAHGITVNAPDGATVTYSETESGAYSATAPVYTNAGNYTVFYKVTLTGSADVGGSETVTISKKDIVISGITVENKPYDGNTNATLIYSGVTFGGIVDGDELTVTATGTFADAETGNGKTVNIMNLTLGGADAGNYQLAAEGQQTTATANITANPLNVTASGWSGVYDGAAHGITVNAPSGATVTYSETENGAYSATAPAYTNAGTYTVFYKVALVGSDDVSGGQTVNISRKEIIISGITAVNKPYDGNTDATLNYSGVTFGGIVDGDELTVTAIGTFSDAEVGNGKTVNITNLTLGGADAENYQLAAEGQQTTATANITANPLNVTASGYSGVYDGEFHGITVNAPSGATVTYGESEHGTYGAENPTYKNTGTYTVYYKVSMTGYADVTGNAVVSISKATLTLSLTMVDRSNPQQERNAWPYADIPGVPSMSARRGVTEVSDYGLTVYSYKSLSGSEYLPYSAEVVESLPVGAYVLRVTVGENRNYLSAETETGFSIEKAVHNDVSAEPLNVVGGERGLFVSLESYLEEGYECAVSEFEGGLFSGEPVMDGGVLRFDTAVSNGTGVVRVTVSSANYEDYAVTVNLVASSALTLRFDANGGSEVTAVKSLRPGEPYGTLPASTRPGYALQGWFTAMTDGEQADASSVMGYADTVLYARWTKLDYTVTALLNGGGLPDDAAGWTVSGDSATFVFYVDSETFMLPEAVMAGYTFTGWTAPGQSVGQAVLEVTVSQGTTENLTYAANWTEGERIGVVEFEKPDDGSGILGVLDLTQESGESDAQKSDTDADEYPATSLAKALKEIACADETQVEETQTKDVTVAMNLRALSDLTDADEGTLDEASRQSKQEQTQIKDVARETFGNDDTVKSDFLSIDLEKTVTVKDDGGGESRESDAMRVSPKVLEIPLRYNLTGRYNPVVFRFHDAAAALRRLTSRPRNYQSIGNGFDGSFYVSGAGNDAVIYIYTSRFSSYSVTTSGVESWTVLFDTDGGTQIPHQSVATAGERKVARPSNPTKDGYTFAGWYVLDNGEEKPFDFDAPIAGDVTIYAKWTENAPVTPVTPSYSGGGSGSGPRSYRIEVADAEHGSVKVSVETATNGQRVTITVTPESGYLTNSVTVKTAADKNMTVTKSGTNVFRFTMPANDVTVSAVFVKQDADSGDTETDAPPDNGDSEETSGPLSPQETGVADWLITDTHPAYINGFSDGTFRPESNITRAQAAMMFYRLLKNKTVTKSVTFKDMSGSEWYAEAVYTLASLGVIQGYSSGAFHGNDTISRAAFTAIAIRLAKKTVPDDAERFSDVPVGHWARETIARASDYGWIGGYSDGTFHPAAPITRAAVTAIINRMLNRNADEEYVTAHYAELNRFSDVTDSNAWYYYNVMEASNAHDFNASEGKERWTR